jgi:hypothetical protein
MKSQKHRMQDRRNPQDVIRQMSSDEILVEAKALAWKLVRAAEQLDQEQARHFLKNNLVPLKGPIDKLFFAHVSEPWAVSCREAGKIIHHL